jgi:glycosyltransferase involved in cell wall biosynthesis
VGERLKILEVNTETTWRGGERQTFYALKGFRQLGQEVALLARKDNPLHLKCKEEGFVCHTVTGHWGVVPFFLWNARQFDVIHVQTASLLTFAVLTKLFHRRKVVYTRRLDFVPKGGLTRWKYNQADLILAISTPIQQILHTFGVKKSVVIPECIEERKLDSERAKKLLLDLGLQNKKIIGTTSALVQHKDPQTLVKAIELLTIEREDFVLLHFGEGVLRPEIESMIEKRGLTNVHRLMGFYQNVEDFFSIMDVFVMSSEEEGLGSSVLDAFVYGVPVVSTNAGGLAEIVQGRGTLVPVKDPKALAKALNEALEGPEKLWQLAHQAKTFAKKTLTIEHIHQLNLEAFRELFK